MHVIAGEHMPCGKEVKRKLEQGEMIDYEGSETKALSDFKCKIYRDGKVAGSPDMLNRMAHFSERDIQKGTGVRRDTIRLLRHGKGVKRSTYQKVINFLNGTPARSRISPATP